MNTPIKLLYVIDCYRNPFAGTEGQLLKLLSGLDRTRFQPELAVFRSSDYIANESFPVPVSVLNVTRLSSPPNWIRLFRFLLKKRREGYRLAHIFFNDASIICPPVMKLLGYRVLISRRDMGYWYTRWNLLPLRLNALYVDGVVANSEAVRANTTRRERYAPDRIGVIYNGYGPLPGGDPAVSIDDLPGSEVLKVVMVANIRPVKRMQDAIHALASVSREVPGCLLAIIGDGDHAALEALAGELNIGGQVRFLGPRRDVRALLKHFDIGILCSESEGFSNTIIEYLQAGLAVVCTRVGGNPEIIEHGETGLLYEPGDVDGLASCLLKLAADPVMRAAYGKTGQQRVNASFGMPIMIESHQRLYESLLSS